MDATLHAPPPVGRGVYWAITQNWRRPLLIGVGFIAVVLILLVPHFMRLSRMQRETFAATSAFLETEGLIPPPSPRAAVLSRSGNIFHWRGVTWRRAGPEGSDPLLFSVKADATPPVRVLESQVLPYDRQTAYGLGIFHEVPEPAPAP